MESKEPRIAKTLLKEDTMEDLSNIKAYKVIIINPVLRYCFTGESMEEKRELRNRPVHICKFNFYSFCTL